MRVLLLELNEITWRLIDRFIAAGRLPTFAFLKRQGAWGTPTSVEMPPIMDPWVTWTTVYTGLPQTTHKVLFLEQPPETIHGRRLWEIVADGGLPVGVFGSLNSWPPRRVDGFWVPGSFAQTTDTYPKSLQPIQELNVGQTRGYNSRSLGGVRRALFEVALGARLVVLGLRLQTIIRILAQLGRELVRPKTLWKRVSLQPVVNFDLFSRLYRHYRPHFATFHTNHVAHYQHLYWRAMDPASFPEAPSAGEVSDYGRAIEHGYAVADEVLRRALRLLTPDSVLVVASSMGQQPYIDRRLTRGKRLLRLRSFDALCRLLELEGRIEIIPTMSDQFNIYPSSDEARRCALEALTNAYVDRPEHKVFFVESRVAGALTVCLDQFDGMSEDSTCHMVVNGKEKQFRHQDYIEIVDHTKSGYHHPEGMLIIYGAGIPPGAIAGGNITNLDLAPTMLALMELPIPTSMTGRVLDLGCPLTAEHARALNGVFGVARVGSPAAADCSSPALSLPGRDCELP
jgi:hypothetical protein